jgi:hypothetical protein
MSEVFHEIQLEAALEPGRFVVIRGRPIAAAAVLEVGPSEITLTYRDWG